MTRRADLAHMLRHPGNVTAGDLMKAAEERGWLLARVKGSHHIYVKGDLTVAIQRHAFVPTPTIQSVIRVLIAGGD